MATPRRRSTRIQQRVSESETSDFNTDDESITSSASKNKSYSRRKSSSTKTINQKVSAVDGIPPTVDEAIELISDGEKSCEILTTSESPVKKVQKKAADRRKSKSVKIPPTDTVMDDAISIEDSVSDIDRSEIVTTSKSPVKKITKKATDRRKSKGLKQTTDGEIATVYDIKENPENEDKINEIVKTCESPDVESVYSTKMESPVKRGVRKTSKITKMIAVTDANTPLKLIRESKKELSDRQKKEIAEPVVNIDDDFITISFDEPEEFIKMDLQSDGDKVEEKNDENKKDIVSNDTDNISTKTTKPRFKVNFRKYDTTGKKTNSSLLALGSELKKNLSLRANLQKLKYPNQNNFPSSIDVCGLDGVQMSVNEDEAKEPKIQTKLTVKKASIAASIKQAANQEVNKLMKKSVLPSDMEKEKNCPKFYTNKHKVNRDRKKKNGETAGPGWYNLPKTEITDEIKKDLQVIKMRSTLDSKHHYKRSDTKAFPKFFQMGTIVEGAHEFYSSRVSKKNRKRTMVDELLADAEFRKKNKKRLIEYEMRKGSGGKGYYKKKMEKRKSAQARK